MNEVIKAIKEVRGYADPQDKNNYMGTQYDGYRIITNKNEILLLVENGAQCCETCGFLWCNDDVLQFYGAQITAITITDRALNTQKVLDYLSGKIRDWERKDYEGLLFEGDIVFINFETPRGVLQFVAYNSQNGYYGHTVKIRTKYLDWQTEI